MQLRKAQATVALQLNQGERKKRVVYRFFLDFFVIFCVKTKSKGKKTEIKNKQIATLHSQHIKPCVKLAMTLKKLLSYKLKVQVSDTTKA
jgi:hypothetical protein